VNAPTPRVLAIVLAALVFAPSTGSAERAFKSAAKDNFKWHCAQCHGEKGNGKGPNATADLPVEPRDLTSKTDIPRFTDDQVTKTLTHGGPANELSSIMPPWGNTLSKKEIEDLLAFVRTLGGPFNPDLGPPEKTKRKTDAALSDR